MYATANKTIVYDNQQYIAADGTKYPGNWQKDKISELHKVTETAPPTDTNVVITGFYVDSTYKQVWTTQQKTNEELFQERKSSALIALNKSDITLLRCIEKNIEVPDSWREYRKDLRKVINDELSVTPKRPAYPEGT